MATEFQRLLSPMRIGRREVRNRIVFQGHRNNLGFIEDRDSGQRYIAYQEARARGGVGVNVLEDMAIHPTTTLWDADFPSEEILTDKYRRMADALHKHGSTVIAQMVHRGRENWSEGPVPPWGFSAIPSTSTGGIPHVMTVAEIREVIGAFARRSEILKTTGVDGVELHATHGGIIQQSYSTFANTRQDEYGGDFQRRLRFATEVIAATRDAMGPDLILGLRVSGDDWMEAGNGIEDIIEICKPLVAMKKLDYINVSAGFKSDHYAVSMGSTYVPPAVLAPFAAAFKEAFPDVPIWTTDRIKAPAEAEGVLSRGQADMIGMTRALISDPDLPQKAKAGDLKSIRECISCRQGCVERATVGKVLMCVQNPEAGREYLGGIKPAASRKRVLVVGGGPSGLETARVAAERGHQVTVCEASDDIGGQIRLAMKAPTREEFEPLIGCRRHQLERLGVPINLNTKVDAEFARSFRPDAIVLATGAIPFRPPIPGVDQPHVLNAWEVLSGEKPVGERVVLIDLQGEHESMSVADFLLEQGKQLRIATPLLLIGQFMHPSQQKFMQERLCSRGAKFLLGTSVASIGKYSLMAYHNDSPSEKWAIEGVDTVVLATGYRANDGLVQELAGIAPELHVCGDCSAPRRMLQAVGDGYRVGALI